MRYRSGLIVLSLLMLLLVLAGCAASASEPAPSESAAGAEASPQPAERSVVAPAAASGGSAGDVVATVNGQPIRRLEFERQVARFQAAMISQGHSFSGEEGKVAAQQVRKQVLEAMIDQLLIDQAAEREGITVSEGVLRQRIESDIEAGGGQERFEAWLETNGLTLDEYAQMMRSTILTEEMLYKLSAKIPDTLTQVHLRQILVASEREAADLRRQLDAGADFAELARAHSLDESSRSQGGDRGFVPLGTSVLPPELEAAVAGLGAGEIAGPIPSTYGDYLLQVGEVAPDRPLSPEMRQGLTQEAFINWIQEQRSQADIQRFIDLDN